MLSKRLLAILLILAMVVIPFAVSPSPVLANPGKTFHQITPVEVTPDVADSWQDVDVSAHIAAGATGVILHYENEGASNQFFGLRKNGSTDNRTEKVYGLVHSGAMIGVDGNRTFEAYVDDTTDLNIYLVGYTTAGVTFFDNAYDMSLDAGDEEAWTDIDCSVEAPSADGLIFEVIADGFNYTNFGFRKNGSTDNRTNERNGYNCFTVVIGCDGSQIAEGWILDADVVDFYLVGYITDGVTFNTNATDLSLDSTGEWTDLSALTADTGMGIFEITGAASYGLRRNGSSEDIYRGVSQHGWMVVACDSEELIEGQIASIAVDFWLVGYAEGAVIDPPTVTTQAASDIGATSAIGHGTITDTGGENPHTRGFCYKIGTTGDPTTADSTVFDNGGGSYSTGAYTKVITLSPGTNYRVRAYAINTGGTGYGTTVSLTTATGGITEQTFFPIPPVDVTPSGGISSWVDVDVSSYISPDATGVILHVVDPDPSNGWTFGLRKKGSTDNLTNPISMNSHFWAMVGVDSNGVFQVYRGGENLYIYLIGYTGEGVTFFTNGYDKSLGGGDLDAWTDIDASAQAPNADGLIFEVVADYGWEFGMRKKGSTDDRTRVSKCHNSFTIVIGCDTGQVIQGYSSNVGVTFILVGYITDGVIFNTNATDVSLSSSGEWLDMPALPTGAVMGIFELVNVDSDPGDYGLREKGSSEEILHEVRYHSWGIVESNDSGYIQGYAVDHTDMQFWLIGYALGDIAPSITTGEAVNETQTSATLQGTLTNLGDYLPVSVSFEYGLTTAYGTTTVDQARTTTGAFSADILGLIIDTLYHFRTRVEYNSSYIYGSDVTFTTTTTELQPPTSFVASRGDTQVALSWVKDTNAINTLVRRSTDTYPISITGGVQVYFGTSSGVIDTGLSDTQGYFYSAWSEADGEYSTSYTTAYSAPLGGAAEDILAYPDELFITDVVIFQNYQEENDQLIVFRYSVTYNAGDPSQLAALFFAFELYDGTTLTAKAPVKAWGHRPGSIYFIPDNALTVNQSFTLKIIGIAGMWVIRPEHTVSVSSENWDSSPTNLTDLDTWVWTEAEIIDGTWVTTTPTGQVLTDEGCTVFNIGIPGLSGIRVNICSSSSGYIPVEKQEFDAAYEESLSRDEALGTYVAAFIDDTAEVLHTDPSTSGTLIIIVICVFLALVVGVITKDFGFVCAAVFPILIFGTITTLIPFAATMIATSIVVVYTVKRVWF